MYFKNLMVTFIISRTYSFEYDKAKVKVKDEALKIERMY